MSIAWDRNRFCAGLDCGSSGDLPPRNGAMARGVGVRNCGRGGSSRIIRTGRHGRRRAPAADDLSLAAEAGLHELGRCLDHARRQPDGQLHAGDRAGRGPAQAPKEVRQKLTWPPEGHPGYDMTGLDLQQRPSPLDRRGQDLEAGQRRRVQVVHERRHGGGRRRRWPTARSSAGCWVSTCPTTRSCRRPVTCSARSDGTKTWGKPEVLLDPEEILRLAETNPRAPRRPADRARRRGPRPRGQPHARRVQQACSSRCWWSRATTDKTWKGPIPVVPDEQRRRLDGEEFDVAELANGDLLCVFRRADPRAAAEAAGRAC